MEKAFAPLLAGIIGVSLLAAVLISTFVVRYHGNVDMQLTQIDQMQKRIEQLNALRQVDPRTEYYNKMYADFSKLIENRRNWIPVFELLSKNVPPTARVVTMGVKEREKMTLQMEFADWKLAAEYVTALQQSGLFETVQVAEINKQEKDPFSTAKQDAASSDPLSAVTPGLTVPGASQPSEPPAANSAQKVVTPDEYVQSIENGQKPAASKSDELLNELNWLINRQASKQQFQLDLPDKPFQTGSIAGKDGMSENSPFSKQELEAAQKSLEELKKTQIKEGTELKRNTPSMQTNQVKAGEPPEIASTVTYYNVSIQLTLKQLSKSK
ncbi:hypothetical protein ACFQI7_12880 [Paenibacillus allorhizosphaerae]|uniref:Uncharacterized protein n=1 Tax=Paenibacillus allorhizosphaerae TaxID=2849866 RepID=A0ABM8VL84_9BACL|nr:hypothetical protein [Paenibacillus allorhizosphaerae]CAG7648265.1 hypothetical protein PAECIP111802_04165 [Paenibacillus allorhizosphaerae]